MGRTKSKTDTDTPPKEEGAITKAEAIRLTLAEGITAAEAGTARIKEKYGLDVTKGHFASSKSREKPPGQPAQEAPRRGRPPGKTKGVIVTLKRSRKPKAVAPAASSSSNGEHDLIGTLEALKPLIAAHGADKLKRLVDLLG